MNTDRRGFLRLGNTALKGALALSVLPGLAAAENFVGSKVLWFPDQTIVPPPNPAVVIPNNELFEFVVRRYKAPLDENLIRFVLQLNSDVVSTNIHGPQLYTADGKFVACHVSVSIQDHQGFYHATTVST